MTPHFLRTDSGQLIRAVPKLFKNKKERRKHFGYPVGYGPRCKPEDISKRGSVA